MSEIVIKPRIKRNDLIVKWKANVGHEATFKTHNFKEMLPVCVKFSKNMCFVTAAIYNEIYKIKKNVYYRKSCPRRILVSTNNIEQYQ